MERQNFQQVETKIAIERWNALALVNTPGITIAHNPALFHFFSGYLNLASFYLFITRNNQDIGLLPLMKMGKKMVSIPHFSYGGILWLKLGIKIDEGRLIRNIATQLLSKKFDSGFYCYGIKASDEIEVDSKTLVEVRLFEPLFGKVNTNKITLMMQLGDGKEVKFNSNLRRKINKAQKNGIVVKRGGEELIPDFSRVYNRNMQSIGSPTLGKSFFKGLLLIKDSNADVFVAYLENKPIGGGFCMWYDGYYENIWFSTLQDYNKLYTSYLLHDTMIKAAIEKKANIYSMGRSTKNSGTHRYKQQWPVEEKELYFSNTIEPGFSLKDQKWLSKIWKHLPGFFVDAAGPMVAKRIY